MGVDQEVEIEDGVGPDDEALGGPEIGHHLGGVVAEALGEPAARTMARVWRAHEVYEDERRPGEGLRERKKRLTRQRISDIATALFVAHGFDAITVAQVAEKVGVSEKTVYNYFTTKESLVFDQADQQLADATAAVRNRRPGVSPSVAIVQQLKQEITRMAMLVGGEDLSFMTRFRAMVGEAPQLRAALADQRHTLVNSLTVVLAAEAGVDPRDPEPVSAARALVSLHELFFESFARHVEDRVPAAELLAAVESDLERAARLLDTGLWSFHLMVEGRRTKQQLLDAAASAERSRKQVVAALRDAKAAWRELRDTQRDLRGSARERGRERRQREPYRRPPGQGPVGP